MDTYEKKYNEILAWAKKYKARLNGVPIEEIFPELRESESEDERVRKWLVEYFGSIKETVWIHRDITCEQILEWLEKQKEQKEELVYRLNGLMQEYINESKDEVEQEHRFKCYKLFWDALEDTSYFDEQKEQKPELPKPHKGDDTNPYDMSVSEAQEYAINRGFGVPFNDGEVYVDERHLTQTIGNILRWADEHPKEQKPAWKPSENKDVYEIAYERYPINNRLVREVTKDINEDTRDGFIDGYNYCNSTHWKPSEEQMEALEIIVRYGDKESTHIKSLRDLYEQLKKL